ncbi:MAG TPA: hypothetical protein VHN17_02655 [Steroidobacteraceae bacterium]|jgi:hypothetical protein|nr:hypothetical protein [Steroidobacteraceae bacterium]
MTASKPPRPDASVRILLDAATSLFRATLLKCLPFAMLAVLCLEIPNLYWVASGHTLSFGMPSDTGYWVLAYLASAVTVFIVSAMMLRQRALASGAKVDSAAELAAAARRLPGVLLGWILAQLSLFVGFTLLIVPGIFLLVCYLVLLPVLLFEHFNPYAALVRSVRLMQPHWWKALATIVIAVLILLICTLAAAALLSIVAALLGGEGSAVQAIVAAVTIGIWAIGCVFLSALALTLHSAASSSA